jgi:hypothetical protein
MDSIGHNDKRKNISSEDLPGFVKDDAESPKTMLYQRDPSPKNHSGC